jgi:hypothetical protein
MNALAIMQPDELETIQRTAKLLAASGYFGASDGITGMAQVATKIMAGREIGIGPFASVNGIHIIKGKPAIGANLMAGAVKSSGRYDYRVRELTATVCKIEYFQRNGDKWESLGISEFTYAEATKAGTQNLDKFPKNMLFARAMSNGVRFYCPDIFSGNAVYVPEELGAEVDGDGNVVDVTPTYTTTNATNGNGDAPVRPDALFEDTTPYYVHDWNKLTGNEYDLVKRIGALHKESDGPCTAKQYQYLTGIMDSITEDQHNYALSLLCQSDISKANMVGAKVASLLIKKLVPTDPEYRQDVAEMITSMAKKFAPVAA